MYLNTGQKLILNITSFSCVFLTNHSDEFVDNNFVGELTLLKEPFFLF